MSLTVRLAEAADLRRMNDIYNHFVLHSTCTYQETPETLEAREAWFRSHGGPHPITVAETGGAVVGWGSLSPYRERSAYRYTVENSVYVDAAWHRCGVGSAILVDLIARARTAGHRTILAGIDASQEGSIALHAKVGFERVGHLRQVGYKFDRWLDCLWMQLMLH